MDIQKTILEVGKSIVAALLGMAFFIIFGFSMVDNAPAISSIVLFLAGILLFFGASIILLRLENSLDSKKI